MNRTLHLDHWPPSIDELADAFVLVEAHDQRVSAIIIWEGADEAWQEPTARFGVAMVRVNGRSTIWGTDLTFRSGSSKETVIVQGSNGSVVILRGPGEGPPSGPIHQTPNPPPLAPRGAHKLRMVPA